MATDLNPYFAKYANNSANRDAARAITLQVIAKVVPDQAHSSAFVVEPLLDHAAQGQLVRAGSDQTFAMGGSDLLILVVVPIVVSLLTRTFERIGVASVQALPGHQFSLPSVSEA